MLFAEKCNAAMLPLAGFTIERLQLGIPGDCAPLHTILVATRLVAKLVRDSSSGLLDSCQTGQFCLAGELRFVIFFRRVVVTRQKNRRG